MARDLFERARPNDSFDDLKRLRSLTDAGLEGAIVGKALYTGAFTLSEALAVATL